MDTLKVTEAEDCTLANSDVITKYINSAEIVNEAMEKVISNVSKGINLIYLGASVYDLCVLGDKHITESTAKVYNKKVKGKVVS